jgi:purine-binding chemotaxis protein CheW
MSGEKERVMGIVVDAVSEVYNIPGNELQPAPDFGGVVSVEFVRGLASIDDKMLIILDIDKLCNADEMAVMESATGSTPVTE